MNSFGAAKPPPISEKNFYSNPNQPDRRPPLSKDRDGDWVHSQQDDTSNTQVRRSSRPTKSVYKAPINRPPAEKDPYPTDHV